MLTIFEAIGTHWQIEAEIHEALQTEIHKLIDAFDKNYSRFRPDSLVVKMSQQNGVYTLPDDAEPLMDLYKRLYEISHGLVTPLIGEALEQAGYDAEYSLTPKDPQVPPTWQEALDYDYPRLTIKQPVVLDFGAAGKGYLIDLIGKLLHANNVKEFCINGGGDILAFGKAQKIGLEDPDHMSQIIGEFKLADGALCGSAGNLRKWEKYTHILDPKKLESPTHIKATWVMADTALLADGLATALSFVSPKVLYDHFRFEYAMIVDEGLQYSTHFKSAFFWR